MILKPETVRKRWKYSTVGKVTLFVEGKLSNKGQEKNWEKLLAISMIELISLLAAEIL